MVTYKDSGVDIDKGNRLVDKIKEFTKTLPADNIISSIGGFSALYSLANFGSNLVLSAATDGVGTKLMIAQMADKHDTVGIDLVAMNVNDIITTGTKPVFFLDYISYSSLKDKVLSDIIKGIVSGLKQSSTALIGGETAQMPDMYENGEYDLAGFCIGIAQEKELIKNRVKQGDILIGISSSGFHSNGYSLLRRLFFDVAGYSLGKLIDGVTLSEILLRPTNIYVNTFDEMRPFVKAAVHITGGGFYENIPRVLPAGLRAVIEKKVLPEINIFKIVQEIGSISNKEMYRTFNMGIGFIVIIDEKDKEYVKNIVKKNGFNPYVIGYIEKGEGGVNIV